MADSTRRDPFTDLSSTMDRLFEEGFSRPWRFLRGIEETQGFPVEVSESNGEVEVWASLPGVRAEDIDVTVNDDLLMIKAESRKESEEKHKNYYRQELRYGMMQRGITLPCRVETDRAEATFENGMLRLRLPKSETERPKQIHVSTGEHHDEHQMQHGGSNGGGEHTLGY
ncbi:MAG TPA: Hsp20/alpha crystallin family protein [Dehalococcoidia bacterium]|jgi:HSP20 family protein